MENRLRRYCGEHKRKTDVDLSATLCAHPGCTGYAVFGLVRGKVVMCGAHRLLGMTDVKNTRWTCRRMPHAAVFRLGQRAWC
mmetsp:Transcript_25740/g.64885  ORF Transcript_25740/g.64885 Transcript_25740/m.64885 type:complete len:82 (-) Transcript_25740:373-618(-)